MWHHYITEGNRLFSCLEQQEDETYDITTIPPNEADHPVSTTIPSLDTPKPSLVKEFQPVSLSPVSFSFQTVFLHFIIFSQNKCDKGKACMCICSCRKFYGICCGSEDYFSILVEERHHGYMYWSMHP